MASPVKTMSNGISSNESDKQVTLAFMREVKAGKIDVTLPEVHGGECEQAILLTLHQASMARGDLLALDRMYKSLAMVEDNRGRKKYPLFAELVAEEEESESPWPGVPDSELSSFAPLPENARLPKDAGVFACSWLDEYIAFSRKWSPRAYDGF